MMAFGFAGAQDLGGTAENKGGAAMIRIRACKVWQFSCPYCGTAGEVKDEASDSDHHQTGRGGESYICDACGKEFMLLRD
jgi:predicted RNA-binding Zn-ribbon protein involved in translation (DUF1610 family)